MKYVSARWVNPPQGMPGNPTILAIGDDGMEYSIPSEDSDVPPWPQYLIDGGTIAPADPNDAVSEQITAAPDDLFGGPTLAEIFNSEPEVVP